MKTLFGFLLGSMALASSAWSYAEPTLQCKVMRFSNGAQPINCGQIALTQKDHTIFGVGECQDLAVELTPSTARSGTQSWSFTVGVAKAQTIEQASCVSFVHRPPSEFSFRGNVTDGTIQLNCRTQDWP